MSAVIAMTAETEPTLRNGVPVYVIHRLERWALETKNAPPGAWPAVTVLGRMIEHGPGASAEGPQVQISDDSAEIDHIVARMPMRLRKVVEKEFKVWATQEVKAKQCHLSVSTYKVDLRSALWFVFARLQA